MPASNNNVTLIIQYNLISNYDVNCYFRFREVQLGNHISYPDVAKIYQVVNRDLKVLTVSDNTTWSRRLFQALTTLLVK